MTIDTLVHEAARVVGAESVRTASAPSDIVSGVTPSIVVAPSTVEMVAATLAWASSSGLSVVIRGNGTKDGWGEQPSRVDVLLSFGRLNQVVAHEAADLTATVQAGARLSDVNARLRQHRQWLPLDPPHAAEATIGGVLATNDAGPLRHRHGTPRDMVIGMTVVMSDGTIASSGGRVVKNVAGYDIARLMAGSHGSLAAIVSATFKLAPVAPASKTLAVALRRAADVTTLVDRLRDRQCEPEALDVRVRHVPQVDTSFLLLVRYGSVPGAVDDAVATTRACAEQIGADAIDVVAGEQQDQMWVEHDAAPWSDAAAVLRLSWRPGAFIDAVAALDGTSRALGCTWIGRAAVGSGVVGLVGSDDDVVHAIDRLRKSPLFDHVVVVAGSPAIRARVATWQTPESQRALWAALKQTCDPAGTLNAGRGPS